MTDPDSRTTPVQTAFEVGDYAEVVRLLSPLSRLPGFSVKDRTRLGVSLMRSGNLQEAQPHLDRAALLGSQEAAVEGANLLRSAGQSQMAMQQLQALLPSLHGELRLRALRWLGVCEDQNGVPGGLERVEAARAGYMALGDVELGARLTQTLAAMYSLRGQPRQARQLLDAALPILEAQPNRRPFLTALCTLADLQLEARLYTEAGHTIDQALPLAAEVGDTYNGARLRNLLAMLALLRGDVGAFLGAIHLAIGAARENGDGTILELDLLLLADHYSRMGQHERAVQTLASVYQEVPQPGLNTATVEAMLARRRGDLRGAYRRLMELRDQAEGMGRRTEAARAWLQATYTLYLMHDLDAVQRELPAVLSSLIRQGMPGGPVLLRGDFDELSELLEYAKLDPNAAPLLSSVLHSASDVLGAQADLLAPESTLELLTLGQMGVVQNGALVQQAGKRSVVPVLTYISLHPNSTKQQLQADLFSEKNHQASAATVRRIITDIQDLLGPVVIQEGSYHEPTYRISPKVAVSLDVQAVMTRLTQNNVTGALAAYKGEFLNGVHDSQWVDGLRERIRDSLREALRPLLLEAELDRDDRRVVLLCSEALRVIPQDPELLEKRLQAAEQVCGPVELARYRSEFRQALN